MRDLSIGKLLWIATNYHPAGDVHLSGARPSPESADASLNPDTPASVSDADLSNFKLAVTATLAPESTAVLLDPEYSAAQAVAGGIIPNHVGLVVALEATGYTGDPNARQSRILPGWSAEKAKRMGANAVKLLVYYHPNAVNASETEDFVGQVAEDCQALDLLIMLEPLTYPLDDQWRLTSDEKRAAVIGTARKLSPLGIDILKVEFPLDNKEADQKLWFDACQELSAASTVPWILLSAAVDFDTYLPAGYGCLPGGCQRMCSRQGGLAGSSLDGCGWPENIPGNDRQRAIGATDEVMRFPGETLHRFLHGECAVRLVQELLIWLPTNALISWLPARSIRI